MKETLHHFLGLRHKIKRMLKTGMLNQMDYFSNVKPYYKHTPVHLA